MTAGRDGVELGGTCGTLESLFVSKGKKAGEQGVSNKRAGRETIEQVGQHGQTKGRAMGE